MQMNEYLRQRKLQQQHQQLLGRRKEIEMDQRARDLFPRQPDIMSLDTNQALTMKSLAGQSRNIQHSTSAGISYLHPLINEGVSTTPLEGWPLNVRDHFQHRLQHQQLSSLMQFPQAMNQYQSQQNYMLQAQPKSPLLAVHDLEGRQLDSGLQEGYPLLDTGDGNVVTKKNNEHRQQHRQGAVRKKSQSSDCSHYKQDKEVYGGSSTMFDDSLSNSSQRNDQAPKNRTGQKRKVSSSGHAKKTITSSAGPSPSAVLSSSSSHRTADSPQFSRPSCLLGNYGGGKHASDAPSCVNTQGCLGERWSLIMLLQTNI